MAIHKTRRSQEDLDGIAVHLTNVAGPQTALRFVDAVEAAFTLLEEMPAIGALLEMDHPRLAESRYWTLRRFPKYVIYYQPVDDGIVIIRVLRGEQDAESRLLETME